MSGWETSDDITHLAAALDVALNSIGDIVRGNTATVKSDRGQYSYTYANLADVLAIVRPALAAEGLFLFQTAATDGTSCAVATTIMHRSGQWLRHDPLRLPLGATPQTAGSAITYARRYSLLASLGLATEDDDGAAASRPQQSMPAPAPPREQATNRSAAEAEIRRMIAELPGAKAQELQAAFREQFGSTLSNLPVDRHGEALSWVTWTITPAEGEAATPAAGVPADDNGDPY